MSFHRLMSILVPVASMAILACNEGSSGNGAVASASAVTPPSAAPSASAPKPHPQYEHHGGLAASIFRAASDLDLTQPQQDSVAKIEASLKADDDGLRAAMKAFRTDLIAGIKAGKLDTAKLTADDAVVDKAHAAHQTQEATALGTLHDLLTPAQRGALVTAVRAKEAEHEAHMTGWLKAREADGGAVDLDKKRLDKMTADLSLDAGQQKQVAAILAKASEPADAIGLQQRWTERKQRSDALLASFGADTFDAKKVDLSILPGKTAHDPMDHMVAFFTQLLPILHPDQRDKLAASLDRPFGGHGATTPQTRTPADDMAFPFSEPDDMPVR